MKSISANLFCRGKANTYYLRRRIPTAILAAYPDGKFEIVRSLRTSDKAEATKLFRIEQVRIDAEFADRARAQKGRQDLSTLRHIKSLTDEHLRCLAQFWVRQVLLSDKDARSQGMDDDEFDERGQVIAQQREELGKMLARGQTERILPALHSFIHLCGLDITLPAEQAQKAGYVFLEAVVTALDHQTARQSGKNIDTDVIAPAVPHPARFGMDAAAGPDWNLVFNTWKNYVKDRPKSTVIGCQTPWGQLKVFAAERNLKEPAHLTAQHLSEFVAQMGTSDLAVKTINGRLGKVKEIFRIAVGKQILPMNPARTRSVLRSLQDRRAKKDACPSRLTSSI